MGQRDKEQGRHEERQREGTATVITDVSAFTNCVKLNFKGKLSSK